MWIVTFFAQAAPFGFDLDSWRNLITIVAFFTPFVLGGALYWGAKAFVTRGEHSATRKETARNIRELKAGDMAVRDMSHKCIGQVELLERLLTNDAHERNGLHEHMGRLEEQVQQLTSELSRYRERMARVEERMEMKRSGND